MTQIPVKFEPFEEHDDVEDYLERFEFFLAVNKVKDEHKVPHLLSSLGAKAYAVLKNLAAPQKPSELSLAQLTELLIKHFKPKPPVIAERFAFHKRDQHPGEPIKEFLIELRRLARTCTFGDFLEQALRDRLVCGMTNSSIQKKLLAERDLTLQRAVDIATAAEMAVLDQQHGRASMSDQPDVHSVNFTRICNCCGKKGHIASKCRFRQEICFKCRKQGHLQRMCKEQTKGPEMSNRRGVDQVEPKTEKDDDTMIWTITGGQVEGYYVHLNLDKKPVRMELDTGAAVSVMSEHQWNSLFGETKTLEPYEGRPLQGYSGQELIVIGQAKMNVEYAQQQKHLPLLIVAGDQKPALFGRNWMQGIQLDWARLHQIRQNTSTNIINKFPSVFSKTVGTITGYKAVIRLKQGAKPIFKKSRSVAYALQPALETELDRMQAEGILQPVEQSEWATPLVIVPKTNGKIRVCGDFKVTVNQCVETKSYPLPTTEDIFAHLAGGRVFTKLDLSQAYLQLPVDEDSKDLLVINTPKGLFRYNRLPYGISVAPAIFQSVMDRILQGLPVACYLDDILIAAPTVKEHDALLLKVFQRLQESGVHLREEKCQFSQEQVEYLGYLIDATGIHPTTEKVRAIKEAPKPCNITQLRAFAGLINYYGKFLPQIATHMAPLYKLMEKDHKWEWTDECNRAFLKCKDMLTCDAVLVHYDSKKPIKVACDASSYGLGAVLSHVCDDGEHPIAFVSRTLTKAERNYSQIEKEALGLVFGIKKFHKYLFGRSFTLLTDHKPLLSILSTKANVPPITAARMQRWAIFLSAYDYNIEFRGTTKHANADSLSRLPLAEDDDADTIAAIFTVSLIDGLPITASDIATATAKDPTLMRVYQYVLEGWPQGGVGEELKVYHQKREHLSTDQGCILWGTRVIIPQVLQARLLKELHYTHPGIIKMKLLARSYLWWPKLDQNIEEIVKSCRECATNRSLPPVAPLHSWPWANQPMKRVHIDFAEIEGWQVLVIIDVHSKWIEAIPLRKATAATTISSLQSFFSTFGFPEEMVSDNGPQFTAQTFSDFCKANGVKHMFTPPYHPSSNGAAERSVQIVKQAMRKMGTSTVLKDRLARFLLIYRSTPHATTGMRPDELFLHRRVRTRFTLLSPNLSPRVEKCQKNQKVAHDGKKVPSTFVKGEKVLVLNKQGKTKWLFGTIVQQKSPVTYLVRVGSRIRFCHMEHLLHTEVENMDNDPDPSDDFPELRLATAEPEASDTANRPPASLKDVEVPLRRSARESKEPRRLIEEL